jgi:hypothetical protein
MRQFKWIQWNLQKIDAHGLSAADVIFVITAY